MDGASIQTMIGRLRLNNLFSLLMVTIPKEYAPFTQAKRSALPGHKKQSSLRLGYRGNCHHRPKMNPPNWYFRLTRHQFRDPTFSQFPIFVLILSVPFLLSFRIQLSGGNDATSKK
jgi:hypothetical protein